MSAPELNEDSEVKFGMHSGKKVSEIPRKWLLWVNDQKWFRRSREHCHLSLRNYIIKNIEAIKSGDKLV